MAVLDGTPESRAQVLKDNPRILAELAWCSAANYTCSYCPDEGWGDDLFLTEHVRTQHPEHWHHYCESQNRRLTR